MNEKRFHQAGFLVHSQVSVENNLYKAQQGLFVNKPNAAQLQHNSIWILFASTQFRFCITSKSQFLLLFFYEKNNMNLSNKPSDFSIASLRKKPVPPLRKSCSSFISSYLNDEGHLKSTKERTHQKIIGKLYCSLFIRLRISHFLIAQILENISIGI